MGSDRFCRRIEGGGPVLHGGHMEIDRERQAQALAKAKEIIADQEKKREAARVEKGVVIFLQGKFDILHNDELVENLASYILNKYITEDQDGAIKILQKLGKSLCWMT